MALSRSSRTAFAHVFRTNHFHTGSVLNARQSPGAPAAAAAKARRAIPSLEPLLIEEDALEDQVRDGDDAPEPTHKYLQQQREMLYYMRLIEHEMPKLVAYRKPFVPPNSSNPLVIRSISYGGEPHPATAKRTIVVPVARLPLKNEQAIHKFKVLAGVRWTPEPPKDSGLDPEEGGSEHGYFKISCEDFPKGPMNLKWASDTLDRLLAAANDLKEAFADIPVDTRHIEARTRKAKKGGHIYGRQTHRPTLRDFPKEWLPVPKGEATSEPSTSA
ncbi:mitochondrial ribosomal subunit protein-domain-containing protein [Dichomitus squalens]|uniref:Mitochondrial ribosomal subunit protein-domain-containing protein n=1 Tax=Dichomitus squalens TaxID=114155 RepID=A0A4Q9N3T1_9APHY|nr:mitochondrial ribosomal subunit protein-domain-containing protein [Dichomitus squalens]